MNQKGQTPRATARRGREERREKREERRERNNIYKRAHAVVVCVRARIEGDSGSRRGDGRQPRLSPVKAQVKPR